MRKTICLKILPTIGKKIAQAYVFQVYNNLIYVRSEIFTLIELIKRVNVEDLIFWQKFTRPRLGVERRKYKFADLKQTGTAEKPRENSNLTFVSVFKK